VIAIRPMRVRHLRGVTAIERQTNHRPWSLSLFAGELKLPTTRFYVVGLDGSVVVGFAGVMYTGAEAHITNVGVDPDRRREGIATKMLLDVLRDCGDKGVDSVTLEVRMRNRAAQELYRGFGFAPGGVRHQYYRDVGEDALIMWAHDTDSEAYRRRLADLEGALALTEGDC
jgi:ribosomal-protein-alanine N-acetyltransferase